MDAAGVGHGGVLAMPAQMTRKEWRAVSEGSGRERPAVAGNLNNHGSRVNNDASSGRFRVSRAGMHQNLDDLGKSDGMDGSMSPHKLAHQGLSEDGGDAELYEEEEHLESSMDGLSLENIRLNSSMKSSDLLQHRLHEIIRQREQLQRMEVELRAQFIASSEILRLQNGVDEQAKQHAEIVANLQEEVHERDHRIHDLEQQLEEKERQLRANQLEANEAVSQVWAKDDLLREQTSEMGNLRRECDNAIAEHKSAVAQLERERTQNLTQLQDLKEQVQQKECQVQEYEEQCRSTQDALIYKDEQLREAQLWMQRAQELDAFHASANNSLHVELRERTDQMNHMWLGYQRQMAETERYHAQALQKLQLEIAELKEQNHLLRSPASANRVETKDDRMHCQNAKEIDSSNDQSAVPKPKITSTNASVHVKPSICLNGTVDGYQSAVIQCEIPQKVEHAAGLPVVVSPILSMTHVLPPAATPVMHQLQQVVLPSLQQSPMQIPQPPLGHFEPAQAVLQTRDTSGSLQTIQHHLHHSQQQQSSQVQKISRQQHHQPNNQFNPKNHTSSQPFSMLNQAGQEHISSQKEPDMDLPQHSNSSFNLSSDVQQTVHCLTNMPKSVLYQQNHFTEQVISSQSHPVQLEQPHLDFVMKATDRPEAEQQREACFQFHEQEKQSSDQFQTVDRQCISQSFSQLHSSQQQLHVQLVQSDVNKMESFRPVTSVSSSSMEHLPIEQQASALSPEHEDLDSCSSGKQAPDIQSSVQPNQQLNSVDGGSKGTETLLLDERSLLSCLVRVIPAEPSLQIRISTTLPNRLAKMLAPLHWHDYKKQYGRLFDFVNSHHELFVIDGDFIHLREGAHALVSSTTAVAKAVAAMAVMSPVVPNWSSVVVTPVAQTHMKRERNSKGLNLLHKSAHKQSQNSSQQANMFPQQGNGNMQLSQASKMKNPVVSENRNTEEKHDVKQVTLLGLRPVGMVSSSSTTQEESDNGMLNDLEGSGTSAGGHKSYHVNKQHGRDFRHSGKQEFISRPQTQENSISVASATAAH